MKLLSIIFPLFLTAITLAAEVEVTNGTKPTGKALTLAFTEELRLGPDSGDEHHLWSGATVAVEVDKRGHMFVVDTGGNRIMEFDAGGKFVRQIGSEGEGPGEFRMLMSFVILEDGTGIAYDNRQAQAVFSMYDAAMNFKDSKQVNTNRKAIRSVSFSPSGKHFSSFYMSFIDQKLMTYTGVLNAENLDTEITLHNKPVMPFDGNRVQEGAWWSEFYASWFNLFATGAGTVAFAKDGSIYTASTAKYEITKWSQDLDKQMVIKREYKPILQTEADLAAYADPIRAEILSSLPASLHQYITPGVVSKAIELAEFPSSKQPIFGMVPLEDGGLLVVHDFDAKKNASTADLFDKDGKYIGQAQLPKVAVNIFGSFFGNPVKLVFKGGKAYAIEMNEDLEPSLVRYAYVVK